MINPDLIRPNIPPTDTDFEVMQDQLDTLSSNRDITGLDKFISLLGLIEGWCLDTAPPSYKEADKTRELIQIASFTLKDLL